VVSNNVVINLKRAYKLLCEIFDIFLTYSVNKAFIDIALRPRCAVLFSVPFTTWQDG